MHPDDPIARYLRELEELLLTEPVRRSAERLEALLDPSFMEFGSSGRVFTRAEVIEDLGAEAPAEYVFEDFRARLLAPGIVLTTYRVTRGATRDRAARRSLRSSIWGRGSEGWRMVFHQGTVIPGESGAG